MVVLILRLKSQPLIMVLKTIVTNYDFKIKKFKNNKAKVI